MSYRSRLAESCVEQQRLRLDAAMLGQTAFETLQIHERVHCFLVAQCVRNQSPSLGSG